MLTKKLIIALCLILFASPAYGTTYYADGSLAANCTSGNYSITNRTCTGSDGNAYQTVQGALNVATTAGDVVYVRAGTYAENVSMTTAGSSDAVRNILSNYTGETATVKKVTAISKNYITVNGLNIANSDAVDYTGIVQLNKSNYAKITNNNISYSGTGTSVRGIQLDATTPRISNVIISGNEISEIYSEIVMLLNGDNHEVSNNNIHDTHNSDIFYIFGDDISITDNFIHDSYDSATANHADILQTFGPYGDTACSASKAARLLFERNLIYNIPEGSPFNLELQGCKDYIKDWVVRNNIFVNIAYKADLQLPGMLIENNTFINVGHENTTVHPLFYCCTNQYAISSITKGNPTRIVTSASNTKITGTGTERYIYFEGFTDTNWTTLNGTWVALTTRIDDKTWDIAVDSSAWADYTTGGYMTFNRPEGSVVKNNAFIGCSDPTSNSYGWYNNTQISALGVTADYNYVAKPTTYAAKTGFNGVETHGVSGGDPKLSNIGGTPTIYANASYYTPTSGSTLISAGVDLTAYFTKDFAQTTRPNGLAWTIGAYENDPLYNITPSAGSHTTITPSGVQTVASGTTASFTITVDNGWTISVGGTCGGSLVGSTYTTSAITGDCTVEATETEIKLAPWVH